MSDRGAAGPGARPAELRVFDEIQVAMADRVTQLPFGFSIAAPSLPSWCDANRVYVTHGSELRDADELVAAAKDVCDPIPGADHLAVTLEDGDGGARLAQGLDRRGWRLTQLRLMRHRGELPEARSRTRLVTESEIGTLREALAIEEKIPAAILDQMHESHRRAAEAAERRTVVALDEEGIAAALTDVYVRDGVGIVDNVATLQRARHRGLGSAAVVAAMKAGRANGGERLVLFAEPDVADGFYAPLGFEVIGRSIDCLRLPERSSQAPPRSSSSAVTS